MNEETARVTELVEQEFLSPGGVILAVGKGAAEWTSRVLGTRPTCTFHVFDPEFGSIQRLLHDLAPLVAKGQLSALPCDLGDRRSFVPPRCTGPTVALDDYCAARGVPHLGFVRIDASDRNVEILRGARRMLRHRRIDVLQIHQERGEDAGTATEEMFDELLAHGYSIFRLTGTDFVHEPAFVPDLVNLADVSYWALAPRIKAHRAGRARVDLAYETLLERYGMSAGGVIQVGAREGEDLRFWLRVGCSEIVFIEGDPEAAGRLEKHFAHLGRVRCISQSVSEERPETRLDGVVAREGIEPSRFNVLVVRAAGAELSVLRGAKDTLDHVEALVVDIYYDAPHENCATIDELDALLEAAGFERVEELCPDNLSSGKALYLRRRRLSMASLGKNGRFANQLLQYFYLHVAAERLGAVVETPDWIGEQLYDLPVRRISRQYPPIREKVGKTQPDELLTALSGQRDSDLWGYFQWHTKWMVQFRERFRSLYTPRSEIRRKLAPCMGRLHKLGSTVVACHLRRGDYGYGRFYVAPEAWYIQALREVWHRLDRPVLYLASDDLPAVSAAFAEFRPVTALDVAGDLDLGGASPFFFDFHVLVQADALAISNSSFSFCAAMLNERARIFLRPDPDLQRLAPFDPWNSEVLVDATDGQALRRRQRQDYQRERQAIEALANAGNLVAARERIEALLARAPDCGEAYNDLAVLCQRQSDFARARVAAEQAVRCEATVALYHRNLAAILIAMGEIPLACQTLEQAFQLDATDPNNCILAGDLSVLTGRQREARRFYQAALDLDPRHGEARERLAAMSIRPSQPCPGQA